MDSGASEHIFKDWKFASDLKDSRAVIETASKDGGREFPQFEENVVL